MKTDDTLLVEIGTEELPPKSLLSLVEAFAGSIDKQLQAAGLAFAHIETFATPRRLALAVRQLAAEQAQRVETRRGPAVSAAFDAAGQPSKAAIGFARACGVTVPQLGRLATADGEWLAYEQRLAGRPLAELIPAMVNAALAALPISKRMRWGERTDEFVRPVHWVVLLYGAAVIDGQILGLNAGRTTRGHRFHHAQTITLAHADDYAAALQQARVIASFSERRERIRDLVEHSAQAAGGRAAIDAELLDEVTALVEWPAPVGGSFDEQYLQLPPAVLIATMQAHQKYFPVTDASGSLRNRFITISNIESRDPDTVRTGNERVIRPRLSDADFFYRQDRARRLESRLPALAGMLFEKRLGSLADKTRRLEALARELAPACGADPQLAARAATLSRCDLLSDLVGEFPELQGTMGGHYAAADGEPAVVARAIAEFYQPRFAGDAIPASAGGRCLALADKLDSLTGIFGIGSAPTGDKDPFALRRAAIGAVRIIIEAEIDLDLRTAIDQALAGYAGIALAAETATQVYVFMRERMRGYYLDRGVPPDVCEAVLANDPSAPADVARRLAAVQSFRDMAAAKALAVANKRIANILKKLDLPPTREIAPGLLVEAQESELAARYAAVADEAEALFNTRQYAQYMELLASLRTPVDDFFDHVMVMCEDASLRANRLALLARLHTLFTRVADIARLHDT